METKICKKCGIEKPITEFRKAYNGKYNRYYYRGECHDCERILSKQYELTRKDRTEYKREYNKKYREKNKEELSKKNKLWRENNKEAIAEKRKEKYQGNRTAILLKQKDYYEKNRAKILEYHHKYNRDNSKILVKKAHEYKKNRKNSDDFFRFKLLIRDCILKSFKRTNHRKSSTARDIIGIDFDKAWEYLKETWKQNYGTEYNGEKYNIDHIIPLATAKNKKDVIRLCHYTNLQMLKPEDNRAKGDRLDWKISK